jgi:SAM-dependent methyltransferase
MAHPEQRDYCTKIRTQFPQYFDNVKVLDVGSLNINGCNRYLFTGDLTSYIGIDIAEGQNVTFVSKGHEWSVPDATYDTIISTECFEHDKFYPLTLANIIRMLKPNGMFLFTCATTDRAEHGTIRSDVYSSPLTSRIPDWCNYYKNLTEEDIRQAIEIEKHFKEFKFETNNKSHDLYFYGIKE